MRMLRVAATALLVLGGAAADWPEATKEAVVDGPCYFCINDNSNPQGPTDHCEAQFAISEFKIQGEAHYCSSGGAYYACTAAHTQYNYESINLPSLKRDEEILKLLLEENDRATLNVARSALQVVGVDGTVVASMQLPKEQALRLGVMLQKVSSGFSSEE